MQRKKFFNFRLGSMALPMLVLAACGGGDEAGLVLVDPIAKVESIEPANVVVGQALEFTVAGKNLPLTAVLSLKDGSCQNPTARTSSGFKTVCTPGGPGGVKLLTVETDLQASGGTVIDSTHSVNVAAVLPDTGITASQCYAAGSNALVSCTSAEAMVLNDKQDGMVGRDVSNADSSDGKLGFSYTKLDADGKTLPASASSWSCVKDNITGLTWEVKTADGGLRDMKKGYTNYDDVTQAQKWNGSALVNPTQAEIDAGTNTRGFVTAVNAASLCGHADWRLPSADELQGILDYDVASLPMIDGAWFVNTAKGGYWSSSPHADYASNAWVVHFGLYDGGRVGNYGRVYTGAVRLVR